LSSLEKTNEYVEDPKQIILTNEQGQVLRARYKITMSYQPGQNPVSPCFKNV